MQKFRLLRFANASLITHRRFRSALRCFSSSARTLRGLRVLFCGADEFSIYSLRAIDELKKQQPDRIASLDVVCRPDKLVGRGLAKVQEVPIKKVAQELELPLHQIDTFTGWEPPSPVDLIIAVSFGLLVPSRILNAAKYGGLNVHPSMLPDFCGPAPLHRALLARKTHTGLTLQTMHPKRFDHGMIIAQTPAPGIAVPEDCVVEDLIALLGPLGAGMLCECIQKSLYIEPSSVVSTDSIDSKSLVHASKIVPEDRHIDWSAWTADEIILRGRVLDKLWDTTVHQRCQETIPARSTRKKTSNSVKRITYSGPWRKVDASRASSPAPGQPVGILQKESRDTASEAKFAIRTVDKKYILPTEATIEGEPGGKALPRLLAILARQIQGGKPLDSANYACET